MAHGNQVARSARRGRGDGGMASGFGGQLRDGGEAHNRRRTRGLTTKSAESTVFRYRVSGIRQGRPRQRASYRFLTWTARAIRCGAALQG